VASQATSFIGVDLAWKVNGNHSGIVVLTGDAKAIRVQAVSEGITSEKAVLAFIQEHAGPDAVLAVDCSLVVESQDVVPG
jgi:predicted RNase H-like nuclease